MNEKKKRNENLRISSKRKESSTKLTKQEKSQKTNMKRLALAYTKASKYVSK